MIPCSRDRFLFPWFSWEQKCSLIISLLNRSFSSIIATRMSAETSYPTKEIREKCWAQRDLYWKCMDDNKEQAEKCTNIRSAFESVCPELWVCLLSDYDWEIIFQNPYRLSILTDDGNSYNLKIRWQGKILILLSILLLKKKRERSINLKENEYVSIDAL